MSLHKQLEPLNDPEALPEQGCCLVWFVIIMALVALLARALGY